MRARRTTAFVLVGLLGALAVGVPWSLGGGAGGPALAAEVRNPDGVAVIIGNKSYTEGPGEVAFAHRDAEAFRRYVIDVLGYDARYVRVLNDASFGDMRLELGTPGHPGRLHSFVERRRLLSDDGAAVSDVVVFYSGHGMPSANPEEPGSYLLPVDGDPHHPERDGYSVETLYEVVGALPARSVRVFLDACFTGVGGDGQQIVRGSPAAVSRLPEEVSENTVAFTAAKAQQIAYWDDEAGHGMFTQHVLDALYGGGDKDGDGTVTTREVERYLQEHLWHAVLEKNGREQDAVLLDGTGTGATVLAAASEDGSFPARPRLDAPDAGLGGSGQARSDEDGADPARIVLADGYTVADWALLAELRLERGEHTALLAEANRHIRTHGPLAPLEEIRERAVAGLLAAIDLSSEAAAREALTRLAWVAASAGERADVLRLQAQAHRRLGDHASAAETYERWLQVAAQSHPERREVLLALTQARRVIAEGERFAELLSRPFSADTREGGVDWTDLHYAALLNLPGVVEALIDAGMAADVRLKTGWLPFGDALKVTLAALEHGDEFKTWKARGKTPLMVAAVADARAAAEALLAQGADIEAKSDYGLTPLHWAAYGNARETTELLLTKGADIKATDNQRATPLHWAARVRGDARETAAFLLAKGADIKATDDGGSTPLHWAALGNSRKTAELLLATGADIKATDIQRTTPLHWAARGDARETAAFLLAKGADIEARGNGGETPLHEAALWNARETAEFLLAKGADIEARDNGGETPLHEAALGNARETAEFLLATGADIEAMDNYGRTSLHFAAYANARETVEWLVARGADINATNGSESPLDYALRTTVGDEESRAATQALLRRLGGKTAEELK